MLPAVRISDIGLYMRCPRLVYFDALKPSPRSSSPFYLLLRELVLSISSAEGIESQLELGLERLMIELPAVYGRMDPSGLEQALSDVRELLPGIAQCYSHAIERMLPSEVDLELRSERLGLTGRLDRLAAGITPSIIRTGMAPEEGVWKKDRLQLAGYSLLLGEKLGKRIDEGLVEYPRIGEVREVQIHSVDRGRVLRIRDRIRMIREGELPERSEEGRCERCEARERCSTRASLASKLF